jgi:hypothetical protein
MAVTYRVKQEQTCIVLMRLSNFFYASCIELRMQNPVGIDL